MPVLIILILRIVAVLTSAASKVATLLLMYSEAYEGRNTNI